MTGLCVCKSEIQGKKCTICTDHNKVLGPKGCQIGNDIAKTRLDFHRDYILCEKFIPLSLFDSILWHWWKNLVFLIHRWLCIASTRKLSRVGVLLWWSLRRVNEPGLEWTTLRLSVRMSPGYPCRVRVRKRRSDLRQRVRTTTVRLPLPDRHRTSSFWSLSRWVRWTKKQPSH